MAEITDFRLGRIADLRFPAGANFALNSTFTGISLTGKTAILTARSPGQSVVWTKSGLTVGATTIDFNIAPSGVDDSSRVFSSFCESGLTEYALTIYEPGGAITMRLQGTVEWAPPTGDFDAGTADSASVSVSVNAGAPISVDVVSGAAGSTTLDTSTVTSGLSGILKAASNTLEVATAGTDYVATNDSRLTDARTPTSHVHGGISNAGAIGSTSGLPIKTGTSGVLEVGAFGTSSGQFAQGNDSRFHDRSHAITSTSDHTAGNWKVFHSNASGQLVELALGADGTFLKSNGASLAPTFATPAGGGSSITGTGIAYVRSGGTGTGTIGNPALPFPTAQAAWDAGARNLELGSGSHTITHYSTTPEGGSYETVRVVGLGKDTSSLTIDWSGTPATEESPAGKTPYYLRLISDHSVALTVNLSGSNAHSGDNNGGTAPEFDLQHCYIAAFSSNGGSGSGSGMAGSVSGGYTEWSETPSFSGVEVGHYASLVNNIWIGPLASSPPLPLSGLVSATAKGKIIGRKTAGEGIFEECVITDFTGVLGGVYAESTDFTTSTGALVNVSGLSCPIAANEKLLLEVVGYKSTSSANDGMRFSFTGPTAPSSVLFNLEAWTATTASRVTPVQSLFGTNALETTGNTSSFPFRVTCTVINGVTAGTVQFQAGSEASGVSLTISRGAVMRVTRIP
jgi:hypothetical protein